MIDGSLEIKSLGRPCHLGQLYDAKTSSLIPGFSLFKPGDIVPRKGNVNSTKLKFAEVKSLSDRTSSLDVSAELSVSILCGAISVGGGGAYFNNKQDTSESITVAAIAQYRTTSESLELNSLLSKMDIDPKVLKRTHATHVVTGIVYGGNVVGTLTQKSINKADHTKVKGNFSLDVFKGIGTLLSIEGEAKLSNEEKEMINSFNLDIELSADFTLKEEDAAPTDPISIIEVVKKSAKLVGDGVPCEVLLTPLSLLADDIPGFRELARSDLVDITNLYDRILKLENSRAWLQDAVEARSEIFPTFTARVRDHTIRVTKLVQGARDELRHYLQRYRSESTEIEPPLGFVESVAAGFTTVMTEYEKDKDEWRRYQDRLAAAEQYGFPVLGVGAIGVKMSRVDKGMLAAILVPENANWTALMDLYGNLAADIRQWRASIDKPSQGSETTSVSIYADPLCDETLDSLDDEAGTLKGALEMARATKRAVFLTYGCGHGHMGGLEWNVLNQEGWGVIINKEEKWRYIGDVRLSRPHGNGIITYVNQTKYAGGFVSGKRDGFGEIIDKNGNLVANMRGVFIKNILEPQGVLVEVTVVNKDGIPIQYEKVALNKADSVGSHVDRIGTVMEWQLNQRFRLIPEGGSKVDVVGSMIDPREPLSVETSRWILEGTPKVTARMI